MSNEEDLMENLDIEERPLWYIKYDRLIVYFIRIFGGLFILSGIVSLLGLIKVIDLNFISIVYIICLLSLAITIISMVILVIARENRHRFDL